MYKHDFDPINALNFRAVSNPDEPAVTFLLTDGIVSFTNKQLRQQVTVVGDWLTDAGFGVGDVCALYTGNTPSFLIAFLAVTEIGGVCVPVIEQLTSSELEYVLEQSGAILLLTTPELEENARKSTHSINAAVALLDETLISQTSPEPLPKLASREATCLNDTKVLMYTSGSSGRPKGVELSSGAINFTIGTYADHQRLTPSDSVLICMPMFHINGMMQQLLPALISGAQLVIASKFSVSAYWNWVDTYAVTIAHLVSGPIRLLLNSDLAPNSNLRLMTFGLPLETEEIRRFENRFHTQLIMVWGLTETCCGATATRLDFANRGEYQNVGFPLRGWEVFVREADKNGVGELMVRSPGVMSRYHNDAITTKATIVDGAIATGDLGFIDHEGSVHFVSRKKDMLKPSGENVAAEEVAQALLKHEMVEEVGVFGIPDPIRTERVVAAVVLKPDQRHLSVSSITESSRYVEILKTHCGTLLASFKIPSEIVFIKAIPKTSIGKPRVSEIRDQYLKASLGSQTLKRDKHGRV